MSEEADRLTFRSYNEEDVPFIHHSWGSSYYKGSLAYRYLSPSDFHSYHRPLRERFMAKPTAAVIVCTPKDDPWLIAGWIAVEQPAPALLILHYLYVKSAFKHEGIAAQLIKRALPTKPVLYTHMTERAAKIVARHHDQFREFKSVPHLV